MRLVVMLLSFCVNGSVDLEMSFHISRDLLVRGHALPQPLQRARRAARHGERRNWTRFSQLVRCRGWFDL
jgi:hypothetical protein